MLTPRFDAPSGRYIVEFRHPAEAGATTAWLAGEFNDWSTDALPLEPQPDGSLAVEVALEAGRSYRFRYYLGDGRWENDWAAHAYVDNDHGGADSVVTTPPAPPAPDLEAAPAVPVSVVASVALLRMPSEPTRQLTGSAREGALLAGRDLAGRDGAPGGDMVIEAGAPPGADAPSPQAAPGVSDAVPT